MGQIVRDLCMTMLVALVIHALYTARHTRPTHGGGTRATDHSQPIYAASPPPAAAAQPTEQPPSGFSVFPWAP